ncbi:MAG: TRAP transporter TatT component family protein [Blastocatellia bacterium]
MTKLILISMLIVSASVALQAQVNPIAQSDALFTSRDEGENLKQAASLIEPVAAREPTNYEVWWRLARIRYYLGDREKDQARKTRLFLAGVDAARKAVALDEKRVEGHFWFGANQGEYADLKGALQSLGLVKTIRREFLAALAINPAYENGAIYSALGQIDLNLPRLLGGNERRGIERLEEGLKVGPDNAELKVTLAEVYQKKGRKDEARKLLQRVLDANDPARSASELGELKAKARALLEKVK